MKAARQQRAGLVISIALLMASCFDQTQADEPEARRSAPDFSVVSLGGLPIDLASQRGKTVIIDFWATWCAPCEVQMPVLDALWEERGGLAGGGPEELLILGLSVDSDPAEKVEKWVRKRGFEYPIAIVDQDLAIDYRVIGFPTLFVIDPAGRIHTQHTGVLSGPELESILDEIARESVDGARAEAPPGPG